ncbi:MAG: translation elongation factor Ts [Acholeplasmataceae bacterium]
MDPKAIKELRSRTQAGILACKKALEAAQGDLDQAERLIRKETKNKKSARVASKGLLHLAISGNQAIVYEINGETDFVARHESFQELIHRIADPLMKSAASSATEANDVVFGSTTIRGEVARTENIVDEQLELRRFYRIVKRSDETFGSYNHNGKAIGLIVLASGSTELARDLALELVSQGSEISDEPDEQVAVDRFLELPFIKDPSKTVREVLGAHGAVIDRFYRFELGQGIADKLVCRLDLPCDASKVDLP